MRLRPRWLKLWRDLRVERGRLSLMVSAIAVSLIGIGSVLGGFSILTREMARNYLGTRPASAAFEVEAGVDAALLGEVRRRAGVAAAEAGEIVSARVRVGADFRPLLLFVVDDFRGQRLNKFKHERGALPPPLGTMLVERTALQVLEAEQGDMVAVKTPHGSTRNVRISGVVHDAGLAPAWQEAEGYGYITRETLAWLGEPPVLSELRVGFTEGVFDLEEIEAKAAELVKWLGDRGVPVTQVRVPPPGRHPHQTQMYGVLYLMLTFSVLSLVLSGVLVATSLAAMLARQVREIGILKTLGAQPAQIARLYAALVAVLGAVAVALAVLPGVFGARALATMSAKMLNLELADSNIPAWVFAVQALAGVAVPLIVAAIPISRASRVTVREAIDQHGAASTNTSAQLPLPSWVSRTFVLAVRNAFRRRTRLVLTLSLLAAGGAMFMSAINVLGGWERIVGRVYENRFYDLEIKLDADASDVERLRRVEGVERVEAWGYARSAISRPGEVDVVRTYPDGSHGSLSIMGPPATTELIRFPLRSGRWLQPSDAYGVVLNHMVLGQAPNTKVGDFITLSLFGRPTRWKVVGIVEEVGSPGVAYVTDDAFARAAGTAGRVRMLRVQTAARTAEQRTAVIRSIERELEAVQVRVESVVPLSVLRTAMGDHVLVLIRMLLAMAVLMAVVGALGLASTMGTNVVERTREVGILKTLGAKPRDIARLFVCEALLMACMSWLLAGLLAIPLTAQIGQTVGMLSFRLRLPFVMSVGALLGWLAVVLVVAAVATLVPARRAARLITRDALSQL